MKTQKKIDLSGIDIMNRINNLLKTTETSRDELADYIGKNKQVFTDWKSNNIVPKTDDLVNIARFFNIPLEYLIFGQEIMPDDLAAITALLSTLDESKKTLMFNFITSQCDAWRKYEGTETDIQ